jgi:putative membrane protein
MIMLPMLTVPLVALVALLHLGFMVLEATQWNTPLGRKLTHLSEDAARETVGVGLNMAIYNGFLGVALLLATFAPGVRDAYSAQWVLLAFIVFAGAVGAVTMRNPGIFVFQSIPAFVALCLVWANHT